MVRNYSPLKVSVTILLNDRLGMRNRFRDLAEYHNLIAAHGIMAAMVFLFMIPFAIFMAKWYHRNPRLALRLHIWTQILVFFFVTVVSAPASKLGEYQPLLSPSSPNNIYRIDTPSTYCQPQALSTRRS